MYSQSSLSLSQLDGDECDGGDGGGVAAASARDADWPAASQSQSLVDEGDSSDAFLAQASVVEWHDDQAPEALVQQWEAQQRQQRLREQLRQLQQHAPTNSATGGGVPNSANWLTKGRHAHTGASSSSALAASSATTSLIAGMSAAPAAAARPLPSSNPFAVALKPSTSLTATPFSLVAAKMRAGGSSSSSGSNAAGKTGARSTATASATGGPAPSSVQSRLVLHGSGGGGGGSGGARSGNSSGKKKGKLLARTSGAQGGGGGGSAGALAHSGSEEMKSGGSDPPPAKRARKASIMERFKHMVDQSQVQEQHSKLRSQQRLAAGTQMYSSPPFSDSAGSDSALAGLVPDVSTPPTLYSTPPSTDMNVLASLVHSSSTAAQPAQPLPPQPQAPVTSPLIAAATAIPASAAPTAVVTAAPLPPAAPKMNSAPIPMQHTAPSVALAPVLPIPFVAAVPAPVHASAHAGFSQHGSGALRTRPYTPPAASAVAGPVASANHAASAAAPAFATRPAPPARAPQWGKPPAVVTAPQAQASQLARPPVPPFKPAVPGASTWGGGGGGGGAAPISRQQQQSAGLATSGHAPSRPFSSVTGAGGATRPTPPNVAHAHVAIKHMSTSVPAPAPASTPASATTSAFGFDDDEEDDLLSMLDAVEKKHADFTMSQAANNNAAQSMRPAQPQQHAAQRAPFPTHTAAPPAAARPQAHVQTLHQPQQQQFRPTFPVQQQQQPQAHAHFQQNFHTPPRMQPPSSGPQQHVPSVSSFKGGLPPPSHMPGAQPAQFGTHRAPPPNAFSSGPAALPAGSGPQHATATMNAAFPALPPSQHIRSSSVSAPRPSSAASAPIAGAAPPPPLMRASTLPLPAPSSSSFSSSTSPPAPLVAELDLPPGDPCKRLTVLEVVDLTGRLPALYSHLQVQGQQGGGLAGVPMQPPIPGRHVMLLRCWSELEYSSYNVLLKDEWLPANDWPHAPPTMDPAAGTTTAAAGREGEDVAGLRVRKNHHINVIGEFITLDHASALAVLGPTPSVQRAASSPSPVVAVAGRAVPSPHSSLTSSSSFVVPSTSSSSSSIYSSALSSSGLSCLTSYPTCVLDSHRGLLVTHPHLLISGTRIAASFPCIRRAWLSEKLQPSGVQTSSVVGGGSSAGVRGTLAHDLFERSVLHHRYDAATLRGHISSIILAHLDDIYGVRETEASMEAHLAGLIPPIQRWAATAFRNPTKTPPPPVMGAGAPHSPVPTSAHAGATAAPASPVFSAADKQPPKLHRLLDTEETIWSRHYGLKGKLDASVLAYALNEDIVRRYWSWASASGGGTGAAGGGGAGSGAVPVPLSHFHHKSLPLPLELKTGRGHFSHRAQVMLYTLLLSEKYNKRIEFGLLLYLQNQEQSGGGAGGGAKRSSPVPASSAAAAGAASSSGSIKLELIHCKRNEIRELIIRRNELAYYLDPEVVTVDNPAAAAAASAAVPSSTPQGLASSKRPAGVLEQPLVKLPPMLSEGTRECHTCFEKERCLLFNAVYERGQHSLPPENFAPLTAHLSQIHLDYLRNWLTAIDSEQAAAEGVLSTSSNNQTAKSRLMDEVEGARERDLLRGKCWSGLQVRSWRYAPPESDGQGLGHAHADAAQNVLATAGASTTQLLHGFHPTSTQLVLITFQRCAAAFPAPPSSDGPTAAAAGGTTSHSPRSFLEYDMLEGDLLTLSSDPEALRIAASGGTGVSSGIDPADPTGGAVFSRSQSEKNANGVEEGIDDGSSVSSLAGGGCLYGVASGVIAHLDADTVTLKFLSVPRELKQACEESRQRSRIQVAYEGSEESEGAATTTTRALPSILWRLDRDDYSAIYRQMKHNLISLFFFGAPVEVSNASTPTVVSPAGAGSRPPPKPFAISYGDERRRRLIVERQEPRYSVHVLPHVSASTLSARCCALLHGLRLPPTHLPDSIHMANARSRADSGGSSALLATDKQLLHYYHAALNDDQHAAVLRVLQQQDYTLVLGTPGSGKSTLITFLIHLLTALQQTLLLASYTHSAVDNILIKLIEGVEADGGQANANTNGVAHAHATAAAAPPTLPPFRRFVRIGKRTQVHPKVHAHLLEPTGSITPASSSSHSASSAVPFRSTYSSVAELHRVAHSAPLVATTCLGLTHPLLTAYRAQAAHSFNYCLLDECSQMSHPVSLGPLRFLGARGSFILVGDHNQLPPLVKSPMARAVGMHVSLFQSLSTTHPQAVAQLRTQYRMNGAIMDIANSLVYSNTLRCGNELVRTRQLQIPHVMRMREVIGRPRHKPATHAVPPGSSSSPSSSPPPPPSLQLNLDWLAYIINPNVPVVFLDTSAMHAWDTRAHEQQQQEQQQASQQQQAAGGPLGIGTAAPLSTPPSADPGGDRISSSSGSGSSSSSSGAVRNPLEAALVLQILHAFVSLGVEPHRIGVISPYKAQLTLLRTMLRALQGGRADVDGTATTGMGTTTAPTLPAAAAAAAGASPSVWSLVSSVESATVDRFQGRDKSLIVMSLVRSNPSGSVGQLLQDWRRINVAVTRARCKLVLIGDSCTLKHAPLLAALLDYFAFRQQIYSLPPNAHIVYDAYECVGRMAEKQQQQALLSNGPGAPIR